MFEFLKNMWIMRRIDEAYLQARVKKEQITQMQYEEIISIQQILN